MGVRLTASRRKKFIFVEMSLTFLSKFLLPPGRQERCCDKKWCLFSYMKQILARERWSEGRRESERAVVRTNGYRICGVFPHINLNLTIPHR